MPDDMKVTEAAVIKYTKTYLERELVQSASEADVDPQLASAIGILSEKLTERDGGEIVDIGCGHGSLLARLSTLPAFRDGEGWSYRPVDFENKIDEALKLARKLKLLARTTPMTIEEFGTERLPERARIFFCRNVFHELRVAEAAKLIHTVCQAFGSADVLFVQDLLRFPEGERNNHCWVEGLFATALREIGFQSVSEYSQGTKSGNAWFNLTARSLLSTKPTLEAIHAALFKARMQQWRLWTAVEAGGDSLPAREALVHAVDMELQLASLTRELRDAGGLDLKLDPLVERRIWTTEIVRRIEGLAVANTLSGAEVAPPPHFRERGAQLTIAEEFLRSQAKIAMVHGGAGTGKTTFVQHLLATRLYEKALVYIDARAARGFWPMLEQMMSQLGVNLAADVISVVEHLEYDQLRAAIGKLLNRFAHKMVIVIENLDEVLDSNQRFVDPQIEQFLLQVSGKDGIKVLFSSRSEYLPATIQRAGGALLMPSIAMGRYATTATVNNVLDDYFDRARVGIVEYPDALLEAIDKHPLVAALAGRILQQDGQDILIDERFFRQLKQRLRADLIARLVDGAAEPAMEVVTELRIPVPARVVENLAGRQSLHHAKMNDVIYAVPDRRWTELLTSLGLFRKRDGNELAPASEQEVSNASGIKHARIAEQLERIYREDDDPKWIRESYYHRMLAGETEGLSLSQFAGKYYVTELVASAHYCFEKRSDYDTALALFDAARTISPLDETSEMRRASSLIRTGKVPEGNAEYRRLIADFPNNVGMRRSHVDALLYKREFRQAHSALQEHDLQPEKHIWHARQWGRAELGLHNYPRAIEIFRQLREKASDDPIIVTWLARALQQFGDLDGAIKVLRVGVEYFSDNVAIRTSLAHNLERAKEDEEARPLLQALISEDPGNARAVVPLVKIMLRAGETAQARKVARTALKLAHGNVKAFAHMAVAEVMLAEDKPDVAAAYLRLHMAEDENMGALLIDALLRAAERAADPKEKTSLLDEATAVPQVEALRLNVPVQVVLVRLAFARRDRPAFDKAIANLAGTSIDATELQRLRDLW
jgi:tetratricopeptide (TPR) repeat protein